MEFDVCKAMCWLLANFFGIRAEMGMAKSDVDGHSVVFFISRNYLAPCTLNAIQQLFSWPTSGPELLSGGSLDHSVAMKW